MSTGAPDHAVWDILLAEAPGFVRARIEGAAGAEKPSFVDFALDALEHADTDGLQKSIACVLLDRGILIRAICDPSLLSTEDALRLARAAVRTDPEIDYKLLEWVGDRVRDWYNAMPKEETMRVLGVVDAISDCRRLMVALMKFVGVPDAHVRSKAVKLLARARSNPGWADLVLSDPDPRVRANLIDGTAYMLGRGAEPLLRRGAADEHHRVATAALLALARRGDELSRQRLEQMAAESSDPRRAAASWAMRQLELPETESPAPEAPQDSDKIKTTPP